MRRLYPWLITTLVVLGAGYFKIYFNTFLRLESPILLFFAAIAVSAWYGGFVQGVYANVLSALFIIHYFVPHQPSIGWEVWTFRLTLYTVDCLVISLICAKMRDARVKAEKSEFRLRKVFDSDMIGLIYSDFTGKMLEANDYMLHLLGAKRADLEKGLLSWRQFTPPEYLAQSLAALEEIRQTGRSAPFEKEYLRTDGTRISVSVGATRIDEDTVVAYVLDIHDRKLAERELADSRERLELNVENRTRELTEANAELSRLADSLRESRSFLDSVIENIPNMIFVKESKNLTFVRFNKKGEKLLGQSRDAFIGKNDYDFFPKEQADFFVAKDRAVLDSGRVLDIPEEPLSTASGTRILHTKKIPILDKEGFPQYLLGISEDITDKKMAERQRMDLIKSEAARFEAEKSAARLSFLSDVSGVLHRSLDIQYMINDFCWVLVRSMASWCVVELYDEPSRSIERMVASMADDPEALRQFTRIKRAGSRSERAELHLEIDEEFLRVRLGFAPEACRDILARQVGSALYTPFIYHGRTVGSLVLLALPGQEFNEMDLSIAQDISRRAVFAIENARLYDQASEASRAKSAFLANISHEIRTPLGAMLGFAELAAESARRERRDGVYLDKIVENGQQLLRLVDEVLDLSKAEFDRIQIERIPFSLDELIGEVTSLLEGRAEQKGLKLNWVKSRFVPGTVVSDPLRIRQILLNIIGNAIKFTARGEVSVEVEFFDPSRLEFLVRDTGIGLTPEQADRLFAPFVQADESMTRKFGGTGLGLFISRKLAQLLGGDLVLQKSSPDFGSEFKIILQVERFAQSLPLKSAVGDARDTKPLSGRVLVVEDSLDNQILFRAFLTSMDVDLAENGRVGVEKALNGNYDIVLMDIQMPEMDGFEAIRILRGEGYAGKVIALTAHAMKGDREKCLDAGFDDYLCKPVSSTSLNTCLMSHL